jgi:hypothetical protein
MSPERALVDGIPILTARPRGAGPHPLVLLSHGFTGCKENWLEKLEELAGLGYCAVAIDNRLHGERSGAGFASLMPDGKLNLLALRKVMAATAGDVSVLIDHFSADRGLDVSRIAVAGVSMGGFVTYSALASDRRIKVAMPIIASPFWSDIPGDTTVGMDDAAQAELKRLAASAEPAMRREAFPPRALLGQIGGADLHYNGARVERFYEELRPLYGDSAERARLIVYPGVAHEFTGEMWTAALGWLETYL